MEIISFKSCASGLLVSLDYVSNLVPNFGLQKQLMKKKSRDCNQLILNKSRDDPKICNYPKTISCMIRCVFKHQDFPSKIAPHDDDGLYFCLVGKSRKVRKLHHFSLLLWGASQFFNVWIWDHSARKTWGVRMWHLKSWAMLVCFCTF